MDRPRPLVACHRTCRSRYSGYAARPALAHCYCAAREGWEEAGELSVRISMTERLAIEANGVRLDEQRFPGRQGRILFAYLAVQHGRSVPRDELAELLWGEDLPATWEKALRVLTTKLRALLEECGIDGSSMLRSAFGCYQLTLPADSLDRPRRGGDRAGAGRSGTRWAGARRRSDAGLGGGRACSAGVSARRGRTVGRGSAPRPP